MLPNKQEIGRNSTGKSAGSRLLRRILLFFVASTICLSGGAAFGAENPGIPKVAVFRTQPPYAVELENALKKHLRNLGYVEGKNITYLPTVVVGGKVEDFSKTALLVQTVLEKNPDVIATIGTQASVPAWPIVEKTSVPMVFSGVTYPIEGGLIEKFNEPTNKNITGISYAVSVGQRLALIRKMFPDKNRYKKMAFLYSGQVLQDFTYMKNLKALQGVEGWQFVFINFFDHAQNSPSYKLLKKKLKETNPDIAFGWYNLDSLTTKEASFKKLIEDFNKPVLALTTRAIEAGAIGGILTNHDGLGAVQAQFIDKILKGEKAGGLPPVEPDEYIIRLNLQKAKELGVIFDSELEQSADKPMR